MLKLSVVQTLRIRTTGARVKHPLIARCTASNNKREERTKEFLEIWHYSIASMDTSSDTQDQGMAYDAMYELQTTTDFIINLGLVASYENQSLKYEAVAGTKVDSNEIKKIVLVKMILNKKLMGGLSPSIGYGKEYLDVKNNIDGTITSTDRTIFTLALEKRF